MTARIFIITCLCIVTVEAFACQCRNPGKVTLVNLTQYDIIFTGKVIAVSGGDETTRARFSVNELFKGSAYKEIDVQYNANSNCSFHFAPGETYTIYGRWIEYGVPTTDICTHTRRLPVTEAEDFEMTDRSKYNVELQYLRDSLGIQPFIDPSADKNMGHKNQLADPTQAIVYTVSGLIGMILIFLYVKRIFKRDGK